MIGQLDLGYKDYDAAVRHFETGLEVDARLGAQPFVAGGRLGLAQALAATGEMTRAVALARTAAVGTLCGAVNGMLIAVVRIAPILASLATMQLFAGIAVFLSKGKPVYGVPWCSGSSSSGPQPSSS